MANESAKIDVNSKKTLLAVTDDASAEIRRLLVDPTTGRLKVSATIDMSGYVTTSQSTSQTIGDTTHRLTKLWATDITVTNAIAGSITGNAGTVTGLTLTTNLTNNGGAGTLTWPAAGATLTIPTGGGTLGTAAFTAATAYEASGAVATHAALTTGVHGVGAGTIAKTSDITATKLDDFATPDDNTDLNANTTNHGLLLKATAPAAGLTNVVAIENGETVYKNKALFDTTVPETQAFGDSAAAGSSTVSARRDHKHGMMSKAAGSDITTGTDDAKPLTSKALADAAVGKIGAAWVSWDPSWTNLTNTTGTTDAAYVQIGKTIHFRLIFTLGASSSVGTSPYFTLPVTSNNKPNAAPIGNCRYIDTGTAQYSGHVMLRSATEAYLTVNKVDGTYATTVDLTATVPHTWANTDVILITGTYEAA